MSKSSMLHLNWGWIESKKAPKLAVKTDASKADFMCVFTDISRANINNNIPARNDINFILYPTINKIPKVISNTVAIIPSKFATPGEILKFNVLV